MQSLNHEAQVTVTLTLLAVAAVLALITDYLRIRALRRELQAPANEHNMSMHVLVPDLPAPAVSNGRASRLAAALKQPRRQLSAGAQAAIERGAQLATPRKGPSGSRPDRSLQHAG